MTNQNDLNKGQGKPIRELGAEELDAVAGGGLWHWLKTHFNKKNQKVEWGGSSH